MRAFRCAARAMSTAATPAPPTVFELRTVGNYDIIIVGVVMACAVLDQAKAVWGVCEADKRQDPSAHTRVQALRLLVQRGRRTVHGRWHGVCPDVLSQGSNDFNHLIIN